MKSTLEYVWDSLKCTFTWAMPYKWSTVGLLTKNFIFTALNPRSGSHTINDLFFWNVMLWFLPYIIYAYDITHVNEDFITLQKTKVCLNFMFCAMLNVPKVQQSSVESKFGPLQLSYPHTRSPLQSTSESQSPSLTPHWLDSVQHESSPSQTPKNII